ncbi:MAG TPA: acyltransferase [Paraburkholderia sp.]|jgi:peptidoglycan/LPS O-acetylase OafA/YrhL
MKLWRGMHSTTRGRIVELDFVRGIAIIMVMGFHFHSVRTGIPAISIIEYPLKSFGAEGVNLFFTLSGFLIGGLLLRQYAQTGSINARRFIVRRIFKIWPAYYVLILFHAIVRRHPLDSFLWQNLTNLQNYYGSSIAQTWSLAIEEHFYLVLPAVLLLVARCRLGANALIGLFLTLCVAVLAARSIAVANGELVEAFAYTQYRIDSLLFGVVLAAIYWMKPEVYRKVAAQRGMLVAAVLGLVMWLVFATPHVALDESIGFTVQAIGFCAALVLVLEHSKRVNSWLIYRAVAWVGLYSYGIYLWHSLALAPGDWLIHEGTTHGLAPLAVWALALGAQFAIAIVLGYLMTRAVEYPFLRLREAWFPDRRVETQPPPGKSVTAVGGQLS